MQSCSFHSESVHSLGSRSHFCFSYGRHHFEVAPIRSVSLSQEKGQALGGPQAWAGQAIRACAVGGACLPGPGMGRSCAALW